MPDPSLSTRNSLREFRTRLAATDPSSGLRDDSVHGVDFRLAGNPRLRAMNERGDVDVNLLAAPLHRSHAPGFLKKWSRASPEMAGHRRATCWREPRDIPSTVRADWPRDNAGRCATTTHNLRAAAAPDRWCNRRRWSSADFRIITEECTKGLLNRRSNCRISSSVG